MKPDIREEDIKPEVDEFILPGGKRLTLLAGGRLANLGCAIGHPSFVMSNSFTDQTIAQMALWENATKGKDATTSMSFASGQVYVLPKKLDEKAVRLHLKKVGVKLRGHEETDTGCVRNRRTDDREEPAIGRVKNSVGPQARSGRGVERQGRREGPERRHLPQVASAVAEALDSSAEGDDEDPVGGAKFHLGGVVGRVDEGCGAAVSGDGLGVRILGQDGAYAHGLGKCRSPLR
jgi:hypothetical protein